MRIPVLVIFLLLFCNTAFCQRAYWQQQVNYTIDVTLGDTGNTLDGFEKIGYFNNSPDTLPYIFIHLWPNAYKNDLTAFSEQLLKNNRTDFYFSDERQRGYINRLDFKINDISLAIEETTAIDIIKLVLPQPLLPGDSLIITTPFHVKLPYLFSRCGYYGQFYAITQWYPKAAVYDKDGWHPLSYLDQGEFYNDFGSYRVHITLPENYQLAATGMLQQTEDGPLLKRYVTDNPAKKTNPLFQQKKKTEALPPSSLKQKTYTYTADSVTDFAWFADKRFIIKTDTIQLPNHTVTASCYILPEQAALYANSMRFIKQAIRFYSSKLGDYPYSSVNIVAAPKALVYPTSMEYPMITMITESDETSVDVTIAHEIGHNWLMGILSSNERDHAWMDEGINTYIERKYRAYYYPAVAGNRASYDFSGLNGDGVHALLNTVTGLKKDQPVETTSAAFSAFNYGAIVYEKTADWMQLLENTIGEEKMEGVLHNYYTGFAFKHPGVEEFRHIAETTSGMNLSGVFSKLYTTGYTDSSTIKKRTKVRLLLPGLNQQYRYITFTPLAGYNNYDKLFTGGMIHNYQLPLQKFQFLAAPLYATGSSKLAGAARVSYNHFTKRSWLEASVSAIKYSINDFEDAHNPILYLGLTRIAPSLRLTLYNRNLREQGRWVMQLRSFILKEEQLNFKDITTAADTFSLAYKTPARTVINQLKITYDNNRKLYPYQVNLTIDQGSNFLRAGFTGKYFFNYNAGKQGISARFFAGKYFKLGSAGSFSTYSTSLNMSGPKGNEDYTYSGYFIGRNEYEGWQSQQIMERDGFFKVRTDLLGNKVGKSDNWLAAVNLSGDIPDMINPLSILPFRLPIKLFADIGTYSEAWSKEEADGKLLYDAGVQLSLFGDGLNIYFPLIYSKVYNDYFKSYLGNGRFAKNISFNINLDVLRLNKLSRDIPW